MKPQSLRELFNGMQVRLTSPARQTQVRQMADSIQVFCASSRQLAALQQKTKDELKEIRDVKKAANALLLELQTEQEMVAKLPEGCFSVRVKVKHARPSQSLGILQKMEEFWSSEALATWKTRVAADPELSPVESLIEAVVEAAWPPAVARRSLEIRKAKETSARMQDLPEAPQQNAPLLSSIVDAKRIMADRLSMVREDRKKLQEQCKAAEERIVPELAKLPEGYIRRIDIKDSSGADESFYLRLKPPRKRPPKKFSSLKLSGVMKSFLDERASTINRQELVNQLASPRFGTSMCRELALALAPPSEAVSVPRIALDRLREVAQSC